MILSDILLDGNKQDYLNGITPIPEKYFLNADKLKRIQQAVVMYNEFIKSLAKEKKLAFADINTLLKTARKERVYDSSKMTFNFEKNGGFSNDGVHPNALGQILLANEFISAINSTYSTSLPMIDEDK
jgi:lysophospholipase L1-like esterase